MKRILAVIISVVMVMGFLAACGSDKAATGDSNTTASDGTSSTASGEYKDGVYKVSYDNFDSHGWKAQVELEIKENKITDVKFDYVNKDGKLKTQDAEYKKSMESQNGTYPEKYSKELQDKLLETQDISKVDTVTGATSSSGNFKALVEYALKEMAPNGVTEAKTIPLPKEGE